MKLTSELEQAEGWYEALPKEAQSGFKQLISLCVSGLCGETITGLQGLQGLMAEWGQKFRSHLGLFSRIFFGDRERVERCVHVNLLLIAFRLFGRVEKVALTKQLLEGIEWFFEGLSQFIERAQRPGYKADVVPESEAQAAAEQLVTRVMSFLFPLDEKSLVLPEVPKLFANAVESYISKFFQAKKQELMQRLREFLTNNEAKEKLFIWVVIQCHTFVCALKQVPQGTEEVVQFPAQWQKRAEAIVENLYVSMSTNSDRARKFCPKIKGGTLVCSMIHKGVSWWTSEGFLTCVSVLTETLQSPSHGFALSWKELETLLTQRASYEPVLTRILQEKTVFSKPKSLLGFLFFGLYSGYLQFRLESLDWDSMFQTVLLFVRRCKNFVLSKELWQNRF